MIPELTSIYLSRFLEDNFFDSGVNKYPPYNLEKIDNDTFQITIAVAGFDESEIDVVVIGDEVTIKGQKTGKERNYLYKGIGLRNFERKFKLANYMHVVNAGLKQGVLTINLKREVPEAQRPRKIELLTEPK